MTVHLVVINRLSFLNWYIRFAALFVSAVQLFLALGLRFSLAGIGRPFDKDVFWMAFACFSRPVWASFSSFQTAARWGAFSLVHLQTFDRFISKID